MTQILVIAVDGESGAGKGTLSEGLAHAFDIAHWNSGLDYRAIGLMAEELRMEAVDIVRSNYGWEEFRLHEHVGTDRGGLAASKVAQIHLVRDTVNATGRRLMSNPPGCVVDGRSGAWEFPDIPIKIYLTCELEERARRRCALIEKQNPDTKAVYDEVLENLRQRDHVDRSRDIFPLRKHPDAFEISTTTREKHKTLAQAVRYCLKQMSG